MENEKKNRPEAATSERRHGIVHENGNFMIARLGVIFKGEAAKWETKLI